MSNHRKNAGVDLNKDIAVCMVVGCARLALFRNAATNRVSGSQRGYCRLHKALATESQSMVASRADWLAENMARRTRHQS